MKILCLISWPPSGQWLWNYLPDHNHQIDFLYILHPKDRFPGYGKVLTYYPKFWLLGLKALPVMHRYDIIVTWEANTALPLAFFRSLLATNKPPMVVLNFVLKGKPIFDLMPLIRFATKSIDHLTCVSQKEVEYNSQVLKIPLDRFSKLQGPYISFPEELLHSIKREDYIFSAGRSHRDYSTLVDAVRELPVKLIINARAFNVRGIEPPPNVSINEFLPYNDFISLVARANFVVLPLLPARHASGETFLAQAMSASKAVIVSETYSTAEMIEDGINGYLVSPGDVMSLRKRISYLCQHSQEVDQIGQTARKHYQERWSFPFVAQKVDRLIQQVVDEHL